MKCPRIGNLIAVIVILINATAFSGPSVQKSESMIDLKHLIVIQDNFTEPEAQSLFGFSQLLLESVPLDPVISSSSSSNNMTGGSGDDSSDLSAILALGNGWLLIGAPKSNTSDRDYKGIPEPGVIWRCSLKSDPTTDSTCRILFVDPRNDKLGKADCRPLACPNEKHDHSGLGFTLVGNGDRVVACAPSWQRHISRNLDEDGFKMNGICYWIPKSVVLAEDFSMTSMVSSGFRSQRLFPFLDRQEQIRMNYPIWAWAQTGFSAHLSDSNDLYLGAPGVNGWNGTIVKYQDFKSQDQLRTRSRLNNKNGTQSEFSQFLVLQTQFLQYYFHLEYLGYAVSSGKYFQTHYILEQDEDLEETVENSRTFVVASAPRGARLYGLVLVFEFPAEETYFWLPTLALEGTQFGAYFGYSLLSVDINGDGFDELLVGAPFQKELEENLEAGCVFLYSSKRLQFRFSKPTSFCHAKSIGAWFGASLAKLGDLNGDGLQDFAVGAPQESDGRGAVYVYYGNQELGMTDGGIVDYALKLTPEGIGLPYLMGFGISISGDNVDIDKNSSPDFAIGAHVSQSVVIFRTRPLIRFEGHIDIFVDSLKNGSSDNEFMQILPVDVTYFIVRSCVRVINGHLPVGAFYDVWIQLMVDVEFRKFRILESVHPDKLDFELIENGTIVKYRYRIHAKRDETRSNCVEWIVLRNTDLQGSQLSPKPLGITQVLQYKDDKVHENAKPQIRTITKNERKVPRLIVPDQKDEFCAFCPPATHMSTEFRIPIASDNCDDDGNPVCAPNVTIGLQFKVDLTTSSVSEELMEPFVLGSSKHIQLEIHLENSAHAETVYFPSIHLAWNNSDLLTTSLSDTSIELICKETSISVLECDLDGVLQPGESIDFQVIQRLYPLHYALHNLKVDLQKTGDSREKSAAIDDSELDIISFTASVFGLVDKHLLRNSVSSSVPEMQPNTSTERILSYLKVYLGKEIKALQVKAEILELQFESSIENATFADEDETFTRVLQTYSLEMKGISSIGSAFFDFWFPVRHSSNNESWSTDQYNEDIILVGQAKGNGCKVITANASFYVEGKSEERFTNVSRRQIFLDHDEETLDDEGPFWVLAAPKPKHPDVSTTSTSTEKASTNSTDSDSSSTTTRADSFTTFSEGARHFIDQFHPNQLLRCTHENDKSCIQISCEMKRIAPNHRVDIRFPLFIRSHLARRIFLDNAKAKRKASPRLLLQSLGRIQLFNSKLNLTLDDERFTKMASFVTLVSSTFTYTSEDYQHSTASIGIIWIYLISILIGLIVLLSIIYILFKCGFFKRRRHEPSPDWKPLNPKETEIVGDSIKS